MSCKTLVLICLGTLFLSFALSKPSSKWEAFKSKFGKTYQSDAHEADAKAQFEKSLKEIDEHNQRFNQGKETTKLGVTEFSDVDPAHFQATHKGLKLPVELVNEINARAKKQGKSRSVRQDAVPANFDWRTKGCVSPVKNQGYCGDCWAFAAVASLECQVLVQSQGSNSSFQQLSEQQVTDCDLSSGDMGCMGGLPQRGLAYLQQSGGADSQKDYPFYSGMIGITGICHSFLYKPVQQVSNVNTLTMPVTDDVLQAYLMNGPVAIGVDASNWNSNYNGGVISCQGQNQADHAVTLVGYGDDGEGNQGWIIKNSWGTSWGYAGFATIAFGSNGTDCGVTHWIATYPTIPTPSN